MKHRNDWNIPPASKKETVRYSDRLAVRIDAAAEMLSVSEPTFRKIVEMSQNIIPIQPAGRGTTTLYIVADLHRHLAAEREKALAARNETTKNNLSPLLPSAAGSLE